MTGAATMMNDVSSCAISLPSLRERKSENNNKTIKKETSVFFAWAFFFISFFLRNPLEDRFSAQRSRYYKPNFQSYWHYCPKLLRSLARSQVWSHRHPVALYRSVEPWTDKHLQSQSFSSRRDAQGNYTGWFASYFFLLFFIFAK